VRTALREKGFAKSLRSVPPSTQKKNCALKWEPPTLRGSRHYSRSHRESAAYVAGWLKKLRHDRKLVIHAAAQAQHAADYILRAPHAV